MTSELRAQILYLYHVQSVRTVIIAKVTGLSHSTVRRMLHKADRQDVPLVAQGSGDAPLVAGSHRESDSPSPGLLAALLRDDPATTAAVSSKGGA